MTEAIGRPFGLEPITRDARKMRFAAYDLEWDTRDRNRLRLAGFFDGSRYQWFTTMDAFLIEVLSPKYRGVVFFAHSGAKNDVQFIMEEIIRRGDEELGVSGNYAGAGLIRLALRRGRNVWTFCDSAVLFPRSLAEIGEWVELGKITDYRCSNWPACGHPPKGHDYPAREESRRQAAELYPHMAELCMHRPTLGPDGRPSGPCECLDPSGNPYVEPVETTCVFFAPLSILREYNRRDCEVLYKALAMTEEVLLSLGGELRATAGACAMNLFKRKYLKQTIETDWGTNRFARRAYYSSRVEVFRSGAGPGMRYHDVNSMFAAAMCDPLPGKLKWHWVNRGGPWSGFGQWDEGDELAIVDADVYVPAMHVPPAPYRHPETKGVYFPAASQWRGVFTGIDLALLLRCKGKVLHVYEIRTFQPFTDLSDYVRELYDLRNKSSGFQRHLVKLLLVSAYGKFGERPLRENLVIGDKPRPKDREGKEQCWQAKTAHAGEEPHANWEKGDWLVRVGGDDGKAELAYEGATKAWRVPSWSPARHEWVPIAAAITARARAMLFEHLVDSDPYYADTDSVLCDSELPTGKKLGELKLEHVVQQGAAFLRPKLYRIDGGITHAKGFPRDLTAAEFEALRERGSVPIKRMRRLKENLAIWSRDPLGDHEIADVEFRKALRGEGEPQRGRPRPYFPKRKPTGDGKTKPWSVSEINERLRPPRRKEGATD